MECGDTYISNPRQKDFQRCMKMAVKMIETGALDISGFWSKGYDR